MIKAWSILIVLFFLPTLAFSQIVDFYLKGGLNLASMSTKNTQSFDDVEPLMGFQVGIAGMGSFSNHLVGYSSIVLMGKGCKTAKGNVNSSNYFTSTTHTYYLETPFNLLYKIDANNGKTSFFFGGGAYLGICLTGKNKADASLSSGPYQIDEKVEFGKDNPNLSGPGSWEGIAYMNRWDYGLNAVGAVKFSRILIVGEYNYGLAKVDIGKSFSSDVNKNRIASLSFAYFLNKETE